MAGVEIDFGAPRHRRIVTQVAKRRAKAKGIEKVRVLVSNAAVIAPGPGSKY